jgi:hypothetical protein
MFIFALMFRKLYVAMYSGHVLRVIELDGLGSENFKNASSYFALKNDERPRQLSIGRRVLWPPSSTLA